MTNHLAGGRPARQCSLRRIPEHGTPSPASPLASRSAAACSWRCWPRPYSSGTASTACNRRRAHPPGDRGRWRSQWRGLNHKKSERRDWDPRRPKTVSRVEEALRVFNEKKWLQSLYNRVRLDG